MLSYIEIIYSVYACGLVIAVFICLKNSSFLQNGLSSLPFIGAAVSILDLFNGGGKTSTGPIEIAPMAINMTQKLSGTINMDVPYNSITFRNPGSQYTSYPNSEYPYYNEVLGVFNLLKTPVFQKKKQCITNVALEDYTSQEYFRLSQNIEYVLNPAANVEVQEIKAALLVYADQPGGNFNEFESRDEVAGMDIYRTDYLDASCLPSLNLVYEKNNLRCFYTNGVKGIKFIINLKRKDAGPNTQNVLLVLTYPVTVSIVSSLPAQTACSGGVLQPVDKNTVNTYCSGTAYTSSGRFSRNYHNAVTELQEAEKKQEHAKGLILRGSLKASPNPTKDLIRTDFSIANAGSTKIYLTNTLGQPIKVLLDYTLAAGKYSREFSLGGLPTGIYYLHIETNNYKQTEKVVITK